MTKKFKSITRNGKITMRLYDKEVNRFNYKTYSTHLLELFKSMLQSNIRDIDLKEDADIFELQARYEMSELYMYITIELNSRKNK